MGAQTCPGTIPPNETHGALATGSEAENAAIGSAPGPVLIMAGGTGGHVFAETYDQHLKNVARLRVIEHDVNREQSAAAAAEGSGAAAATPAPPAAPAPAPAARNRRNGRR